MKTKSLLQRRRDQEKEKADRAAELKRKHQERELLTHPLLSTKCNRNVRDAYFAGLVFSAIADDDELDERERMVLSAIAISQDMPIETIDVDAEFIHGISDDSKVEMLRECVDAVSSNSDLIKLFVAQFIRVWTSHTYDEQELLAYLKLMSNWTDISIDKHLVGLFSKVFKLANCGDKSNQEVHEGVIDKELCQLADWMGESNLRHCVAGELGDVLPCINRERARLCAKRRKEEVARKKALAAKQEESWQEKQRQRIIAIGEEADTSKASVCWSDLEEIANQVSDIDRERFDWVSVTQYILDRIDRNNGKRSFLAPRTVGGPVDADRKCAWMLIALCVLANSNDRAVIDRRTGMRYTDSLDGMLKKAGWRGFETTARNSTRSFLSERVDF